MTRHVCRIAALLAALGGALQAAVDYDVHRETTTTRTLRFSGQGERLLDVRNLHGSIRVTSAGSAQDAVQFDARRTIDAASEADAARAEGVDGLILTDGRPTVEIIVQEPESPICGERWENYQWQRQRRPRYRISYDLAIRVPPRTRLRLCTIDGREISVAGTTGDFDIDNVNGRITLDGVRGSGRAKTVNGAVTATLLTLPDSESEFTTINGDVTVTWPAGLAARLRLKTFNGGLFTDFLAEPIAARARPLPERRDGRFVYQSQQFTEVQVGRGGPEVTLASFNGDVRVLQASR
jgi:hypothetical protein